MAYRLSALAEQDLEEIWSYVAEDASPATADRLIDRSSIGTTEMS
jgi:plasmid stabilization system protein ParE